MKNNNTMPTLTIVTADNDATPIKYVANMRFADFMKHNDYDLNNIDLASDHYKQAKTVFAKQVEAELAKIQAIEVKQSAVFKGGTFRIRSNIIKEQDANVNSEQHEALVRQWAHKKAIDSQKAQEKASVFLAEKAQAKKAA